MFEKKVSGWQMAGTEFQLAKAVFFSDDVKINVNIKEK